MYRRFTIQHLLKSIILIVLIHTNTYSIAQSLKGLYVDDFKNIIGNNAQEDLLLSYAKAHDFNYLILYNTTSIHRERYPLDEPSGQEIWKHFIMLAKTDFNILKIGVVGEKAASFIPVMSYNKLVKNNPLESIDVINLEFEFWNKRLYQDNGYYCTTYLTKQGFACTSAGAFDFYFKQLKEMQKLKGNTPIEIETYIGNPTDEQLSKIAKVTDRLLIHYYRENTDNIASYKMNRLMVLQRANPTLKIAPIFSSRENHLGPWLKKHTIEEVTPLFFNQLNSIKAIDMKTLNFDGVIWYRYSNMPK